MTLDPKAYEFARIWLAGAGYTWSGDVQRLAERIQSCAEDYIAELQNEDLEA